jgi:aspartate/methionine/tyrosine aminotransferase
MKITPFKIERFYAQYEFTAPYMLSSSDCESLTIAELLTYEPDSAERFQQLWLGYTEAPGHPALREAITPLYTTIHPDQVLVMSGAEEGIFLAMNALLNPGDEVIVHAPHYQSLSAVADSIGCEVREWVAREQEGWALDLAELRALLTPKTRMIVVNCPHNPTGYLMSGETYAGLIQIVREWDVILFSDEVYRGLEHDPATRLPAACDVYENALSLGVLSKTYGLPGLRIGWLATRNLDLYRRIAEMKDYTTICNSAPSEFLATLALRHHETLAARSRTLIHTNLALLDAFFELHAPLFSWQRPQASATGFARVQDSAGAEAFALRVVRECGVLLLPSTMYDYGDHHVRVGYGRRNLPEALTTLTHYLTKGIG